MDITKRMRPAEPGTGRHTSDTLDRFKKYTRTNPQQTLPLPPYGKHISANLISTAQDWIFIEVGANAWAQAKTYFNNGLLALVLPDNESFTQYRWPVSNHDILLHWPDATPDMVYNFGAHLVKSGARCVLHPYGDGTWIYPKAVAA